MSVRQSLLAILAQGPCYGYQLRTEYARRTGAASLNVGQIYTTLERLERDGLVTRDGADERGHVYWAITEAGDAAVGRWFGEPDARSGRDDLAHKIALAATLPGVDVAAAVAAQRSAASARLEALEADDVPADPVERIVRAAALAHAHADVDWLDDMSATIVGDEGSRTFGLSAERPRRGRPARLPDARSAAALG